MNRKMFNVPLFVYLMTCIFVAILLIGPGCTIIKQDDGTLGLRVGVDEQTHQNIADAGDTATGLLGALSALFPVLTPIATAAGVGTYTWRRMKGTVTKYKKPMEMYVEIIEQIRQNDPETWAKIKGEIRTKHPTLNVKQTVDEIRDTFYDQIQNAKATT